jgi:hypothetical protein
VGSTFSRCATGGIPPLATVLIKGFMIDSANKTYKKRRLYD